MLKSQHVLIFYVFTTVVLKLKFWSH